MLACAPTGCMLREVAIHVRESQVMASVNKEWADTVRAVKNELTRQLLKSAAELVQGLGIRTLQNAKRNKTISFQDIMRPCHHFTPLRGYDFNIFQDAIRQSTSASLEQPLQVDLSWDPGYMHARDV